VTKTFAKAYEINMSKNFDSRFLYN